MKRWRYELGGLDGAGRQFKVDGTFDQGDEESFQQTITEAQRHAYLAMTGGKTEYGKPGAGACRGPYKFQRIVVEPADPAVYGLPTK